MTPSLIPSLILCAGLAGSLRGATCCAADDAATAAAAPAAAAVLADDSLYQLNATFTDDTGATRTLAAFAGEPVVLTMFFASCGYACPMLTNDMATVREALPPAVRERVHFVMVSFDTDRDTVPALQAYRERMHLTGDWTLLRGATGDVRTLAMLLGVQFRRESSGDYAHSNLITVLDARGAIAHQRKGLQGGLPAVGEALVRLAAVAP